MIHSRALAPLPLTTTWTILCPLYPTVPPLSMSHEVHELLQPTDMCQTMCTEPSPKAAVPPSPCLPHRGLENLHNDVFNAILETLLSDPGRNAIKNLSCVSRGLRNSCVPVLFRDCLIRTHTTHNLDLPPVYARPFIR